MPPMLATNSEKHFEVNLEAIVLPPPRTNILLLCWNSPSNAYEEVLWGTNIYEITNVYTTLFTGNTNFQSVKIDYTNPFCLFRIYQP